MIDFVFVFTAGLLGSMHCVGMCGGFVLAISQARGRGAGLLHQGLYFLGKAVTYAVLGALAGGLGATVTWFAGVQNAFSIVAGVVMVGLGLGLAGVMGGVDVGASIARWPVFGRGMAYFLRQRTVSTSLGLGLINGLLPCGLVYALLAKAASTGTVLGGGLTMFIFGFATVPALLALGLAGHLIRPVWRHRLNRAAAVVVVVLGLLTILRGTPWRSAVMGGGHAHPTEHVESSSPHEGASHR